MVGEILSKVIDRFPRLEGAESSGQRGRYPGLSGPPGSKLGRRQLVPLGKTFQDVDHIVLVMEPHTVGGAGMEVYLHDGTVTYVSNLKGIDFPYCSPDIVGQLEDNQRVRFRKEPKLPFTVEVTLTRLIRMY